MPQIRQVRYDSGAMADKRHRNVNWLLNDPAPTEHATLAVLMDIRDELQYLHQVFGCKNFLDLPNVVRRIEANTTKRKYTKKEKT